jgi:hypothetical protein
MPYIRRDQKPAGDRRRWVDDGRPNTGSVMHPDPGFGPRLEAREYAQPSVMPCTPAAREPEYRPEGEAVPGSEERAAGETPLVRVRSGPCSRPGDRRRGITRRARELPTMLTNASVCLSIVMECRQIGRS